MGTEEFSSKGIFRSTASGGRAFRYRPKQMSALDRFAKELAQHTDQHDIAAGLGDTLDPGGDARACAIRIGVKAAQGPLMLQRIRKKLGPQAV